jgi:hypothetical protein
LKINNKFIYFLLIFKFYPQKMPLQKSHFGQFDAGRSHSDPGQNCAPNSSTSYPDIASGHAEPAGAPIPGRCGEGQSAIAGGLPATGAASYNLQAKYSITNLY